MDSLSKNDLNEIIDKIEESNSKQDAYFGIFQYGGGPDESFLKANKQGLELFAAEILKASRDSESVVLDSEKSIIVLDYDEDWIDGDTCIQYIDPIIDKRENINDHPVKETWKDKILKVGCLTILTIVIFATVTGIVTIARWFY